jgi:SAM-dependent methyltransferase
LVQGGILQIKKCRLCNGNDIKLALNLKSTPVADDYVRENKLSDVQPSYPLDLFLCENCGHVQLGYVVDPNTLFKDYIYTSSVSTSLLKHFEVASSEMIDLLKLGENDLVVDIGSNDGSFLRFFSDAGINVIGIDPAVEIAQKANDSGIETIAEFFMLSVANSIIDRKGHAKLVTANNVFAHAENLGEIADGIFDLLTPDGIFVFEVSYMVDIVENMLFDTIYHEHLCYHTVYPLDLFLLKHGLELIRVERIDSKGGSIHCQAQKKGGPRPRSTYIDQLIEKEKKEGYGQLIRYSKFANDINFKKTAVLDWIKRAANSGQSFAGYGASATVTTLLHHFELEQYLEFLVDDNKLKQGTYSPGHHIPVCNSNEIYRKEVDVVIILAWNYSTPIIQNHSEFLEKGGVFLIPLPNLKVIKQP